MSRVALLSTVKAKLGALLALFVLTVLVIASYAFNTIDAVRVGGPLDRRITQTMNLRADIQTPAQYLIEAELTTFEMAADVFSGSSEAVLTAYEKKLKQLKKDFEDGQKSWDEQLPSDTDTARAIRVTLLEKNNRVVSDYFNVVLGDFMAALRAHDQKQANILLHGSMKQLAEKHRRIIDELRLLTGNSMHQDAAVGNTFVRGQVVSASLFALGMLAITIIFAGLTIRAITRPISAAIQVVQSLEKGNLAARVHECGEDELGKMCESLNVAIAAVRSTLENTIVSSKNLAQHSRNLSTVAGKVTAGVHRQASNLEQTSAQLGEVAHLGQSIALGGREGQHAAEESRDAADRGIEVVHTAISGMSAIGKAAAEITQIIDAVDEISFKTNLLAVNASVEAAVAGEQGRGFRVVAEEIKSLSVGTDAASKKIRQLIKDTNEAILQGTQRVEASGEAFEYIGNSVRKLKGIMDDVAVSSSTQADSLSQLKEAVQAIAAVVDQNSIGTDTINETSRELAKEAQNMHTLVSTFQF